MKQMFSSLTSLKKTRKSGFSMVEVLIALMLLGIVGGGFLMVLANSSAHTITADVQATAESIARSQMESVKNQTYQNDATTYVKIDLTPFGGAWDVTFAGSSSIFNDLQKIRVNVIYNGQPQPVLTLEGYKSP